MAKYKTIFIFFFIIKILFKIQKKKYKKNTKNIRNTKNIKFLEKYEKQKKMIFGVSEIFEKFFNTQPKHFKNFLKRKFPRDFLILR